MFDRINFVVSVTQLDEINQIFLPHMRNKLIWFYQDAQEPGEAGNSDHHKKKLFLSDGWDFPFVGVCIYMFRINISKQLPEEGFQKDLYVL